MHLLVGRDDLGLEGVAESFASKELDPAKVRAELVAIAAALRISPGKLRPDDLIEELAKHDFFAGDALLEIEARLQKLMEKKKSMERLTVRDVVARLAR